MTMPRQLLANADYAALRRLVKSEGLLEAQDGYYLVKLIVGLGMLAAGVAIAIVASHPAILIADAVFSAFATTQVALLSHDVIHRQAFRGRRLNPVLQLFIGNVVLGISHSWWDIKHRQHHANPNHVDRDPDIQLPFISFAEEQFAKRPAWLRPVIRRQAIIFPIVFPLQAVAMYWTSLVHLTVEPAPRRAVQWVLIAAHFALFAWVLTATGGLGVAAAFTLVYLGVFGAYNSSVFASNHKGMPLTTDGTRLDFLREQVLTSRNLDGHRATDFLYGGLNYQIEHHLFPTMPRNNFPRARRIVEAYCAKLGISYHSTSLAEAYRETFRHLHRQSLGARTA